MMRQRVFSVSILTFTGSFVARKANALKVNVNVLPAHLQDMKLPIPDSLVSNAMEKCKEPLDAFRKYDEDREKLEQEDAEWI